MGRMKDVKTTMRATNISILLALLLLGRTAAADLNVDVCRFMGDESSILLELYVEVPRNDIVHKADSSGWYGAVSFNVEISADTAILAQDKWVIDDIAADPGDIDSLQKIVDVRFYKLPFGRYDLTVTCVDSLSRNSWTENLYIEAAPFPAGRVSISDIELASHIIAPGILEKYDRGDFALIPNPGRTFGRIRPFFIYYIEVYPPSIGKKVCEFTLRRFIINGMKDTVRTLPEVELTNENNSFAEVDSVSLEGLTTGSYDFIVQVTGSSGETTVRTKRFFMYRPDLKITIPQPVGFDSAKVALELQEIEIFLNRSQIKSLCKMNITDKAGFLAEFWRRFDVQTATPGLSFRQLLRERIAEADRRWDNFRQKGRRTDPGRIYVLYGDPDTREDYSFEMNAKPYEIWTYDSVEGGVIFVFTDRDGQGELVLVHSTKSGEINNPNWYEDYVDRSSMKSKR